jgi:hypothetical protein
MVSDPLLTNKILAPGQLGLQSPLEVALKHTKERLTGSL